MPCRSFPFTFKNNRSFKPTNTTQRANKKQRITTPKEKDSRQNGRHALKPISKQARKMGYKRQNYACICPHKQEKHRPQRKQGTRERQKHRENRPTVRKYA
ncbi:hypothetical protein [uncultured Coprobacter sp.]|uniref:hypothetical protein n=1 Tax=uncultured Coprobacter sp. TaxID=1720550 RepID=UPI0026281D65|nr:hypothetical protein [uncultured Coprobacter sp.]